jgi:putative Mg2+ transporter-C (MgtC) family protein
LIFRTADGQIDNLTTAATIWFAASLGMGIGLGKGLLAVIATLFYFVVIMVPNIVSRTPPK